ncbi:DNA-processing protein DprA [Stenotrophomonas sp. Marseille-Q4652]|uniref:DNA-processing protein DprA n=1 Tax=Stenotrophomonas sp. Marseille-Q4652 TaxID=2866595 RepID=UPI001CE4047A|nr:DNA-processing protein DprA [Stenotrophomonas sp. Marseille-Q4652]
MTAAARHSIQQALLALVLAAGPTAPRRHLLERFPDPAQALAAGPEAWIAAGCTQAQRQALAHPDQATVERTMEWLAAPGHHLLGWHDPDYPPLLRQAPSPPLALFVDGGPALAWHPAVAVVGSRSPSPGGRDHARDFAAQLAASGLSVASGLASGVDAAAHQAALARADGITVAVIGTGADIAYPRHHAGLQARIAERGAVLSEYPPGTGPRSGHFPARNRILAGLALGTVVIEAAERSGALITARLAVEAGREVFALPGSIHNPMARGCHRLIRDGVQLVESPEEIVQTLAPVAAQLASALRIRLRAPIHCPEPAHAPAYAPPDTDYQRLWNALGYDPTGMDSLIERTGLTAATLSSMLLVMELEGRVLATHGRYVRKTSSFTSHSV